LAAVDGVTQAAVHAREDGDGMRRLVGYVTGTADPGTIRARLAERLPAHMVPAAVVVLPELPVTANGKLDTRALPAPEYRAGEYRAPVDATEAALAAGYGRVLGVQRIGTDESFFDLGGDSISAMRLVTAIKADLDLDVSVATIFEAPTVAALAARLRAGTGAAAELPPVQTLKDGNGRALYCLPAVSGVSWPYQALGAHVAGPIIGLQQTAQQAPASIVEMAADYADRIQAHDPAGPYQLLGWSFGGVLAHAVAVELQRRGAAVATVILLDAEPALSGRASRTVDRGQLDGLEMPGYDGLLERLVRNFETNVRLYGEHTAGVFSGDVVLYAAERDEPGRGAALQHSWRPHVTGTITVHPVDCTHLEMLDADALTRYGDQLGREKM
jgi:thioesterase domain-containing protein/acyl carrier protein